MHKLRAPLLRRCLSTGLAAVAILTMVSYAPAAAEDQAAPLDQQIADAKSAANAAAARYSAAQDALIATENEIASTKTQIENKQREADRTLGQLKDFMIDVYVNGPQVTESVPRNVTDAAGLARANVLSEVAAFDQDRALDNYRQQKAELDTAKAQLEETKQRQSEEAAVLQTESDAMNRELSRLQNIDRQQKEAERKARDAERRQQEQQRRANAPVFSPPTTAPPSGGTPPSGGGDTGSSVPTPPPPGSFNPGGGWLCPIQGSTAFSDTWGAPRSGGRVHLGVDMFAARGTPVVASVSGRVEHRNSGLGGMAYYLYGSDGHTYYGAHLDSFGASGQVSAGTVIGYVGSTGNAQGGSPHLHFEIKPNGGSPVNPYPTVRAAC